MSFALGKAIGRKDYVRSIELLRADLSGLPTDAEKLALIAQCHWFLGEEGRAIEVANEALRFNASCFEAHRILASLHANRRDHQLGILHARNAIRSFVHEPRVPAWLTWLASLVVLLGRGRAAALAVRQRAAASSANTHAWLRWAEQYASWGDQAGILVAANQPFPPAPKVVR